MNNKKITNIVRKYKLLLLAVLVGCIIGPFIYLLTNYIPGTNSYFGMLELKALDRWFEIKVNDKGLFEKVLSKPKPSKDILIVTYDDATDLSLQKLWPYSRDVHAKVVDVLRLFGARAVIFDIIFDVALETDPANDAIFVEAVKRSGHVYLPGKFIPINEFIGQKLVDRTNLIGSSTVKVNQDVLPESYLTRRYDQPYDKLSLSAKRVGFANFKFDPDGIGRHVQVLKKYAGKYYPSIALSYVLDQLHLTNVDLIEKCNWLQECHYKLKFAGREIDLDSDYNYLINWQGNVENGYISLPGWQFVETYDKLMDVARQYHLKTIDEALNFILESDEIDNFYLDLPDPDLYIKDKIVLIGTSTKAANDNIRTPVSGAMPGVFVHASVIDNFLNNSFITKIPDKINFLLTIGVAFLTAFFVLCVKKPLVNISAPFLLIIAYITGTIYLFTNHSLWVNSIPQVLAVTFAWISSSIIYYVVEGREKHYIKGVMSNYMSKHLMNHILSDKDNLNLGGERKYMTVLFSDIRGFTTFSEANPPEEVVKFLNEYFQVSIDVIFEHNGILDKLIGDAIMAFWGLDNDNKNHAELAVRAAVGMRDAVAEMNKRFISEGKQPINIGVGVNTGDMVVGNIGTRTQKNFSVIGDAVNLASRLESLNKTYNTSIIISEFTYHDVMDVVEAKYLDTVVVKGKSKSIKIYEVVTVKN